LMIREENTGDANLTDPYVELEPLGLTLDKDSPHYQGGDDDGDDELDVGETWIWAVIDIDVNDAKTYTVIGHGTDPLGNDVTYCEDSLEPPEYTYCDPNELDDVTVGVLYCSTVLDISASPTEVSPVGTDVTLTITERNIGDAALTDPCMVLEPLGLTLTKGSAQYSGGDADGNDVLDAGETWTWTVVDGAVNTDRTYTAVGHGRNQLGNDVTWCSNPGDPPGNTICDANERDQVGVSVIYCDTIIDISASPMQVSGATDVMLTITEKNTGEVDLTGPYVVLEPLGLTLAKASSQFMSGDTDGDSDLDAGETWTWIIVDSGVDNEKTYTVVGHGTDVLGNDVTWCSNSGDPPADTLCDQDERDEVTVQRIVGSATRTPGFWKTHLDYAEHIFNVHCGGLIDLGWVVVDSNEDIFGVFWANKSRNTNGSRRSELCRARIHASFHALAAILNSCLHNGAPLPKTPAEIATILGGTNRSAIIELASVLGAYNESGDAVTIIDNDGFMIGNADPAGAKAGANYALADCLNGVAVSERGSKGKK